MNLREWCEYYLANYKSVRVKKSTLESYYYSVKHIDNAFPLCISEIQLQEIINTMFQAGKSVSTIKHTMTIISQALKKAYQLRMIDNLPRFDTLEMPYNEPRKIQSFTQKEVDRLGRVLIREGRYNVCFLFLLYTGMRVGEALGLRRSDIDLRRHCCTIIRTNYRGLIQNPKTRRGIRSIPLTAQACYLLRKQFERCPGDIVFNYSYFALRDAFKRVCERAGVIPRGLHALRHTYASFALRDGVNVKTLSAMLGHSSVEFTLDIYCDVELLDKQKEADKISFFSRTFQPSSRSAVSALGKEERFAPHGEPGLKRLR